MPGRGPHPSQTAAIALGRSRPLPTAIGLGTAALTSRYGAPGSQRVAPGIAAAADDDRAGHQARNRFHRYGAGVRRGRDDRRRRLRGSQLSDRHKTRDPEPRLERP